MHALFCLWYLIFLLRYWSRERHMMIYSWFSDHGQNRKPTICYGLVSNPFGGSMRTSPESTTQVMRAKVCECHQEIYPTRLLMMRARCTLSATRAIKLSLKVCALKQYTNASLVVGCASSPRGREGIRAHILKKASDKKGFNAGL